MTQYSEEKYENCPQIRERIKDLRRGQKVRDAPTVSVIMPAYNIAEFVKQTLDSVLAQTFQNFEIIIVNDGSSDTAQLLENLAPYFNQIIYAEQQNAGASRARNLAICLARGEILAFLDGDDIWFPEFLDSQLKFLEAENLEMVYCDAELFGAGIAANEKYSKNSPSNGEVTPAALIGAKCNVITSGTVLKLEKVKEFGLFDVTLPRMQDFDLWFRLAKNNVRIGYQRKVLVKYRVRNDSLSGSSVNRCRRNITALNVVRDKHSLDDAEMTIWREQMKHSEAELALEQGKLLLVEGDYSQAHSEFAKAYKYFRNPKISLVMLLMKISPKLTLSLFKKIRPSEFSFIAPRSN